ncbi:GAF domain-containing protein [Pedobacter sp.]|uniref:GAF domain-containing protein n=1 Tax=Pedobacter sp. TaxID=1411316 RepID=UPI003D7FADF4
MQAIKLDLNKSVDGTACDIGVHVKFSFRPFIDYITRKAETEKTAKVVFYQYILKKFKAYPEVSQPIQANQLQHYKPLFELVYSAVSPLLHTESNHLWAIGEPVCPCFYSGTNAFYKELLDSNTGQLKADLRLPNAVDMKKSLLTSFYNLVLERFYNFNFTVSNFTVKSIMDTETKLLKYYRFNVDNRFLEINYNGELPELKLQHIKDKLWNEANSLQILQTLLPPEKFSIQGIAIVNLIDVTGEYALETVKNVIIKHQKSVSGALVTPIEIALQTLVGCADVQFRLLPFLRLNGKYVMNNHNGFESVVLKLTNTNVKHQLLYKKRMKLYLENPRRLIFPEITEEEQRDFPILRLLYQDGITSYAIFPLYFNGNLVGGIEVYTRDPEKFKNYILSKLETAFSLLSQLMQNLMTDFEQELSNVITDKFTSLQPAVRWRFQEAAYNYLSSGAQKQNLPIEKVFFENVQPFYGAIDIKDSSIKRNFALRTDLQHHLKLLKALLVNIQQVCTRELKDKIVHQVKESELEGMEEISDRQIMQMEDYLTRQLPAELSLFAQEHPELKELINAYLAILTDKEKLYHHSLRYEESMRQINQVITQHLESYNAAVQAIFPCYFEKFRTDGVEFDLYMGQSIAPEQTMPKDLKYTLRLMQLEVMANISRATTAMAPELAIYMQTTQLIFVYEKLIDISFRVDEQRFDVEGSYNIRYQMVKKRIDKAHRKDTQERLTQPGKITIIYFNSWEGTEYVAYIKKLQQQQLLQDDLEYIDVEELQGVEGLKALRVGVVPDHKDL